MRNAFPDGFGTVVFDCDSTLSAIEGIEELAREHRSEVETLTEAAMQGAVPLEEVYARRLALVRPTREHVAALGALYIEQLVQDAREVCSALAESGIQVRIISGGLLPAVRLMGRELGIPSDHIAAVDIYFDRETGAYSGFDSSSPLARSGGKYAVLQSWVPELPRPIMMVGDGSTDLEVQPLVDLFVAYAGVVRRDLVTAAAHVVLHSRSLSPVYSLALGDRIAPSPHLRLLQSRGVALLS